jgi:hypothetical protein
VLRRFVFCLLLFSFPCVFATESDEEIPNCLSILSLEWACFSGM